jgi:hypothetical protein
MDSIGSLRRRRLRRTSPSASLVIRRLRGLFFCQGVFIMEQEPTRASTTLLECLALLLAAALQIASLLA